MITCESFVTLRNRLKSICKIGMITHLVKQLLIILSQSNFFTPPRNRGGVIFSLQFVCVSVCLSVYPALLVIKIPAKRMHRFGRDFR